VLEEERALIGRLADRSTITIADAPPAEAAANQMLSDGSHVLLPLAGMVDVAKECAKFRSELAGLKKQLDALRGRLGNENFLSRAKPDVVESERQKEREWSARRDQLEQKVRALCGD
jgi:valyl-tRNA synthetase